MTARQPSQMREIGDKYLKGVGVKRDKKEAEKWFQRADDIEAFIIMCTRAETEAAPPSEMYTIGQKYENGGFDFLYVSDYSSA